MSAIENLIASYKEAAIQHAMQYSAAKAIGDDDTAKTHLKMALETTVPILEYLYQTDPESYAFHALSRNCGWYATRLVQPLAAANFAKRALANTPPEHLRSTLEAIVDNAELPEYRLRSEFE